MRAQKLPAAAIMAGAGAPAAENPGGDHGFWISYPTVIVSNVVLVVAASTARSRRSSRI